MAADQIQPTFTSPASANPGTAANEQQPDNAQAGQPLTPRTVRSNMPNNEQLLDDAEIDWDELFSEQHLTEQDFTDKFISEDSFLQYNPLLGLAAAAPSMTVDHIPTNLATNQPTISHSPPALQYPLGDNMEADRSQSDNYSAFFNQAMQQANHKRHPFERDGDWDEFVDTAKHANNWGPDDPHLGDL